MRTFLPVTLLLPLLALTACGELALPTGARKPAPEPTVIGQSASKAAPAAAEETAPAVVVADAATQPAAVVVTPVPAAAAATPAQLDTTTAGQKAEAAAADAPAGGKLGTTIASLGAATEPGFWIKSPLVKAAGKGRIVNPATGKSVNVDLIPLPGGGGSQVSLPAMQMLGVGLTDLPEIEVFAA